jgi:hypothetical protein
MEIRSLMEQAQLFKSGYTGSNYTHSMCKFADLANMVPCQTFLLMQSECTNIPQAPMLTTGSCRRLYNHRKVIAAAECHTERKLIMARLEVGPTSNPLTQRQCAIYP